MIRAIFFDIGNVIYKDGYRAGIEKLEAKRSYPEKSLYQSAHDRKHWKDFTLGKITEEEYLKKVAEDFSKNFSRKINKKEFQKSMLKQTKLIKGILNYIRTLHKFKLGVISNHPKEWFFRYEKKFGFKGLFEAIAISGLAHIRKPDIRIFRYAIKKLKVKPEESIYIDDRPERITGASSLGMKIIVFKSTEQLKIKLKHLIKEQKYGKSS